MGLVVVIVVLVVLLAAGIFAAWAFNALVRQRNRVRDAWSGIDVQLTRRSDLVPNLVEVVKGYVAHERSTLAEVTRARSRVVAASGPEASGVADEELEGALQGLYAVAEAYPELRADRQFLELQTELSTLEEDISFARRYYNATVRDYNTLQETFPVVLVAGTFGHTQAEYFAADAEARGVVRAEFDDR